MVQPQLPSKKHNGWQSWPRSRERVTPRKLWSATDAGRAVNPDGLLNQIDGGMAQATSWTLQEAGRWDSGIMKAVDYGS